MRILFYLPVVTPWWFETIVAPMLTKLASESEVHVLAPIFWKGTGIRQEDIDLCANAPEITWHLVNDAGHPSMRTSAVQRGAIVDFVHALAPDYVLCRSADLDTVARFPGVVRHITEGGADPLLLALGVIHFTQRPFDHGLLPELDSQHVARLHELTEPYWGALEHSPASEPAVQQEFRQWAGLPGDIPTLFLPLEYEHSENFFTIHRAGETPNARLAESLIEEIDGRAYLALTNHPLNDLHVDNSGLEMLLDVHPLQARLLPSETPTGARTTDLMMRVADGVFLGNSKCFSLAGFCGTPIIRRSHFATGEWLNASADLGDFLKAMEDGTATVPDRHSARTWFAYHTANNLVCPKDKDLTGAQLLERLITPFDPDRWESNLARFAIGWEKTERALA